MPLLGDLKTALAAARDLERSLFKHILSSYLFSLLAVVAQHGRFEIGFQALTEVLAGTIGGAAVLSAYLGRLEHPAEEGDDLLFYRPHLPALRFTLAMAFSAAMFYVYFRFVVARDPLCLLFLCAGVFIFFRAMMGTVLELMKLEKQKALWGSLPPETQVELRLRHQKLIEDLEKSGERVRRMIEESGESIREQTDKIKQIMKENRRRQRRDFLRGVWAKTRGFRKRWAKWTVSDAEKAEELVAVQRLQERILELHRERAGKVLAGTVAARRLEGSEVDLYPVDAWKYVWLKGNVGKGEAETLLGLLQPLEKTDAGSFKNVVAIVGPGASLSLNAQEILKGKGIKVIDPDPDPSPPAA
ncbi:MAG TPA: hypothetical protein VJB14_15720 [Planctomycetota bacterium]|nr:hypothetical protein [Planctomycetota bacterium]